MSIVNIDGDPITSMPPEAPSGPEDIGAAQRHQYLVGEARKLQEVTRIATQLLAGYVAKAGLATVDGTQVAKCMHLAELVLEKSQDAWDEKLQYAMVAFKVPNETPDENTLADEPEGDVAQ